MYQKLTLNLTKANVRRETLDGRPHLVVPTVILGEDVVDGSDGPIFYPDDENEKSQLSWNHKPVVVYHPEKDGQPVSACDPVILDTRKVGIQLRTNNRNKLLGTEVWLDESRANSVDSRIIDKLNKGEKVEVSTGLTFDLELKEGEFNGKKYKGIARNYRPDHLAILPDRIGAFSIKAGGGMLSLNQASRQPESTVTVLQRSVENVLKSIGMSVTDNELSFSGIQCQLSDLLSAKFGQPGKYWNGWIKETWLDRVVFEGDDGKCYVIGYAVKDDAVSLVGDAEEVKRVVEYQTAGGDSYAANSGSLQRRAKEVVPVSEKKFDKKVHVASLIGNGFEEGDRAKLEAMDDSILQKIAPAKTPPPEPTPVPVPTPTPTGNQDRQVTLNDLSDPADRELVQEMRESHQAEKTRLIATITNSKGGKALDENFLKAKSIKELRGWASVIEANQPEPSPQMFRNDFRGAAGGAPLTGNAGSQDAPADQDEFDPPNVTFNSVIQK